MDTILSTDASALIVVERKALHKIYGLVRVVDNILIRSNRELYELVNDMAFVQRIVTKMETLCHRLKLKKNDK